MAELKVHKVVSALPQTLEADSIYLVRAGDGFDLYITNHNGTVLPYKLNAQPTASISGQVGTAFTGNPGLTGGTKLLFNEFWSTHPDITYDPATRRFTFNRAGVYRCRVCGQTTSSTNRILIGFNSDAPGLASHRGQAYAGPSVTISAEGTFAANAGDFVVFYLYEGGLYNDANNRWSQFSIERVA